MVKPRKPIKKRSRKMVKAIHLDALCRQLVFARDEHTCQWCGRKDGKLDWAHITSRRYYITRWFLPNSLVLCAGCHFIWHQHPLLGASWFVTKFPERRG